MLKCVAGRRSTSTLSANELRSAFLDYFISYDHTYVPPSPIYSHNDPSLPFVNAGMNQFKAIFLGAIQPQSDFGKLKRAVNSQFCVRVGGKHNDLYHVGRDLTHHTSFEMLGNWSFGDYSKDEACYYAWKFLTKTLSIPSEKLYITYFGGDHRYKIPPDHECRDIWKSLGIPSNRILPFGMKDNFWEIAECGPCGPCSEIHFDSGTSENAASLVNVENSSVFELWNLVFLQFNKEPSGSLSPLSRLHIDCGLGFERLAAIIQNVDSSYETDIFAPLIDEISKYSLVGGYEGQVGECDRGNKDMAYRIAADHIRTACILISSNVRPHRKGQGHVLRSLIRRAIRSSSLYLRVNRGFLKNLLPFFILHVSDTFSEVCKNARIIEDIFVEEEETFWTAIERGKSEFQSILKDLSSDTIVVPGDALWNLHARGLHVEVATLLAEEAGLGVDVEGFAKQKYFAQELSRSDKLGRIGDKLFAAVEQLNLSPCDDSIKYSYSKSDDGAYCFPVVSAHVLAALDAEGNVIEKIAEHQNAYLAINQTVFYAEQGGQISDTGSLLNENDIPIFEVKDVQKCRDNVFLIGNTLNWKMEVGMRVNQLINSVRRLALMRNHTATHLLNYALRNICGSQTRQCGSLISEAHIRYDFELADELNLDQIAELDNFINDIIYADEAVSMRTITLADSSSFLDVVSDFDWNHLQANKTLRIVEIRNSLLDKSAIKAVECCCGTHVLRTSDIGAFTIYGVKKIGYRKRRVYAWTGEKARSSINLGENFQHKLLSSDFRTASLDIVKFHEKEFEKIKDGLPLRLKCELREAIRKMKKDTKKRAR